MLKEIGKQIIDDTIKASRDSARGRALHSFHEESDLVQRMVMAFQPKSYEVPHKHEDPDKVEVFMVLKGRVAVLEFDDKGEVVGTVVLEAGEDTKGVEIPPRSWHCVVPLAADSVVYAVIQGPYNKETHKIAAPWAPKEGSPESREYLVQLKAKIKAKE